MWVLTATGGGLNGLAWAVRDARGWVCAGVGGFASGLIDSISKLRARAPRASRFLRRMHVELVRRGRGESQHRARSPRSGHRPACAHAARAAAWSCRFDRSRPAHYSARHSHEQAQLSRSTRCYRPRTCTRASPSTRGPDTAFQGTSSGSPPFHPGAATGPPGWANVDSP
jgi:hypothetical protein